MQHLFQTWESFASAIRASAHVLLLSDYDGTLTPIAGRPQDALLPDDVRTSLRALAERPAFSVGIISGRSLREVRAMVGVEGIYYAGNHGLEIEGPGLSFVHPAAEAARPLIRELASQLTARLGEIQGVVIEDKGLTLSLHYRLVSADGEHVVVETFRRVTSPLLDSGKIRVTTGKKVLEVRPPIDWDKGKALETIRIELEGLSGPGRLLTIYLGDDLTDEDAFKAIRRTGGWEVFVGKENEASNADYFLSSTLEVAAFLTELARLK